MRIKAFIFDFDGVLLDSERLAFTAWQMKLAPLGYALEEDDFQAMLGLDANRTVDYILAKTGLKIDTRILLDEQENMMLSILDGKIEPQPGARELLSYLTEQGYPLAVASNSSSNYVSSALKGLHLSCFFRAIIGRDLVRAGKPAPDVYLAAAAALSVSPSQCMAVEDSSVGVQSAVSAGMCCIAIPAPALLCQEFILASFVFNSLPSLHASISHIINA